MELRDTLLSETKPRPSLTRKFTIIIFFLILLIISLYVPFKRVTKSTRQPIEREEIKGLELAIKGYQTEYNKLPPLAQTDESQYIESKGLVIEILSGNDDIRNPRGIAFYEPSSRSTRKKIAGNSELVDGMDVHDPKGHAYRLHFDWDGDGKIVNPKDSSSFISSSVIVYSAGPDGDYNTWKDNFTSWGR